jgi:hypothetical protein
MASHRRAFTRNYVSRSSGGSPPGDSRERRDGRPLLRRPSRPARPAAARGPAPAGPPQAVDLGRAPRSRSLGRYDRLEPGQAAGRPPRKRSSCRCEPKPAASPAPIPGTTRPARRPPSSAGCCPPGPAPEPSSPWSTRTPTPPPPMPPGRSRPPTVHASQPRHEGNPCLADEHAAVLSPPTAPSSLWPVLG